MDFENRRKKISKLSKRQRRSLSALHATKIENLCESSSSVHRDQNFDTTEMEASTSEMNIIENFQEQSDSLELGAENSGAELCESDTKRLSNFLRDWANKYGISHMCMGSLLRELKKHKCFTELPQDARSLLKTPKQTPSTRTVSPGDYYHFGLLNGVLHLNLDTTNMDYIHVSINIDGLPLTKSSKKQFWSILASVQPYKNVFTVGIYCGNEKPKVANDFLQDFVTEIKKLCTEGAIINGKCIKFKIRALICDAPAKAFVLCTKGHSGYSSCTKCTTEGEFVNGRMCFPDINAEKRTDEDFRRKSDEDYHNEGITTILLQIPNFDPVTNVPLDYMHLVCLGIMRKLMYLWISGDPSHRLQQDKQHEISYCLINQIAKCIPKEFARKPRSLEYVKLWKATEYRQILLYTGPVVLRKSLSKQQYHHFLTLHVIIRIMCSEDHFHLLDYAQELVVHYIATFSILYGVHNISHNVHNLVHLITDVKNFGPLDTFSAFKFENYLRTLKVALRKPGKPLQQIIRRHAEKQHMTQPILLPILEHPQFQVDESSLHHGGPLIHGFCDPQYKIVKHGNVTLKANTSCDSCCGLVDGSIVQIENIAFCTKENMPMIIGYEFMCKNDAYNLPCASSLLGIYLVSNISSLKAWPITNISKKYVKLPHSEGQYVVLPLLHDSTD